MTRKELMSKIAEVGFEGQMYKELYKLITDNWQTITRQGLTINSDPNMDGTQVTGIWSIDEWIKQVNRPKSFASVRSVDLPNLR